MMRRFRFCLMFAGAIAAVLVSIVVFQGMVGNTEYRALPAACMNEAVWKSAPYGEARQTMRQHFFDKCMGQPPSFGVK